MAAAVLERLDREILPGVSTARLDAVARAFIEGELGATAAPLHYGGLTGGLLRGYAAGEALCAVAHASAHMVSRAVWGGKPLPVPPLCGFPASVCISINDVIAHGIPSEAAVLREGDLVNVDVTVRAASGAHGDTSKCWVVGAPPLDAPPSAGAGDAPAPDGLRRRRKLALVAREALWVGISAVRPGVTLGEVGAAIGQHIADAGYSSVIAFVGHGIGSRFHEAPAVRHAAGGPSAGVVLLSGMALTLEPMVNEGSPAVRIDADGWTARTLDGRDSAQWEHTIAVSADGAEVLTLRPGEVPPLISSRQRPRGGGPGVLT
ncbi:hypothetical protein KFE25_013516 [Diacronema lutheri]|uniref:Peptidase M24 domain-containing protein n=2 Tax=Diacronema lutheri TaxID=2081491 RepID=A0A8J5XNI0_DIALT|nr:hypothetical protein KFE25_013516 [Diacronema lutheri]